MTLLELLLAMMIIGIVTGITLPRAARLLDAVAVRGARNDTVALFTSARHLAVARSARATVEIDTAARMLVLYMTSDTVQHRDIGAIYGVTLHSNRASVTYGQTGMGIGASNLTLVIARGATAETLTVSRLGRVRW